MFLLLTDSTFVVLCSKVRFVSTKPVATPMFFHVFFGVCVTMMGWTANYEIHCARWVWRFCSSLSMFVARFSCFAMNCQFFSSCFGVATLLTRCFLSFFLFLPTISMGDVDAGWIPHFAMAVGLRTATPQRCSSLSMFERILFSAQEHHRERKQPPQQVGCSGNMNGKTNSNKHGLHGVIVSY